MRANSLPINRATLWQAIDSSVPVTVLRTLLSTDLSRPSSATVKQPLSINIPKASSAKGIRCLARSAKHLIPFALEAFGILMERGCFTVAEDGRLKSVDNKVRKTVTGTDESIACQRVARFIGREFARIGDRTTVY